MEGTVTSGVSVLRANWEEMSHNRPIPDKAAPVPERAGLAVDRLGQLEEQLRTLEAAKIQRLRRRVTAPKGDVLPGEY